MAKKLTKAEKIHLIANSPEVTTAIKMLAALMEEAKIKKFIQYDYKIDAGGVAGWKGEGKYRFKFQKLHNKKKRRK